ncbi:MAG TPA: thioredoxin [Bacteroidetes bacterium]|nr:thioredoxin [Bacteroidota bacterium]
MENEIILTDQNFDEQIKNNSEAVLVDFWAPWCMPCRIVAPILSDVAKDYTGRLKIAKVNVDENPMTAARFGISSIPTLMLFKDGQKVDQWVGAMPRPMLETALKPHLPEIV